MRKEFCDSNLCGEKEEEKSIALALNTNNKNKSEELNEGGKRRVF